MTLQEFLVEYRKKHGLSQRQFAERCGLSNGYISMLESGKNPASGKPLVPQLPALAKIAAGMNITLTELLAAVDNIPVEIGSSDTVHTSELALTQEEVDLVLAYRRSPTKQQAVRRTLGLVTVDPTFASWFQVEEGAHTLRVADGSSPFDDFFKPQNNPQKK